MIKNEPFENDIEWRRFLIEIKEEFSKILNYWELFSIDTDHSGFWGEIGLNNLPVKDAAKGSVLNSRILWSFSAAYYYKKNPLHLDLATRAYRFLMDHFIDQEFGGVFWSVNAKGEILDDHKQTYAQAFAVYGLCEYFRACGEQEALMEAIRLYQNIERKAYDKYSNGYTEAFTRDWKVQEDQRLSLKDLNTEKSANTHLHLVEAYANLYSVWKDAGLKKAIVNLLLIFGEKIIRYPSFHLGLFFSNSWESQDTLISYGHDIEAAWLLQSCAETAGDEKQIAITRDNAINITEAALKGLDKDGGLWYEYDYKKQELIAEKHWWPQAEALIALANAYQLSGKEVYQKLILKNWLFIKENLFDQEYGEWHWGVDRFGNSIKEKYKTGFWKCPYHHIRACLELLKRFEE